MKTTLITFFFLSRFSSFSQENPWEAKGENPWKNHPANENKTIAEVDSNSVLIDSTYAGLTEISVAENDYTTDKLLEQAEVSAHDLYKSAGDFGAGFTFGLFFNFIGFIPDVIYISVSSNREKEAIKKIANHPDYSSVDVAKLNRKVTNTIKSKKGLSTIGGTVVGSIVQIGFFAILVSLL